MPALLLPHLGERIGRPQRQPRTLRQHLARHHVRHLVLEHRQEGRVGDTSACAAPNRRTPGQFGDAGANEAVTNGEMVIEKCEGAVGRQRGQPQREPGQLHGRGIEIHTVEAAFGHLTPQQRAVVHSDLGAVPHAVADVGALALVGQVAASRHKERAAAHRRVHETQREDVRRGLAFDEWIERSANKKLRDRPRRIETAGRFSPGGIRRQHDGSRVTRRREVEDALVHRPQLFHTKVVVADAMAPRRRLRGGECHHDPLHDRIGHLTLVNERRVLRREQTAIERRDVEVAGPAPGVRHSRDGLKREPQARRGRPLRDSPAERIDRVALPVNLVPHRDKATRFRKQEEQHAIHNRERLLEGVRHRHHGCAS